jgi:two-component system NarL family response regulator
MSLEKIRILVADDHPAVREGLSLILGYHDNLEVVAEAADGQEAVSLYERHQPDVAILDLQMPLLNGHETTQRIVKAFPQAKILLLTTYEGDEDIFRGLRSGARGYLLKEAPSQELVEAICTIHAGGKYLSSRAAIKLADRMSQETLSERELAVLREVANGKLNKEIAEQLSLSEGTIKSHLNSIMAKLGVKSRTEAALNAIKRGLLGR